jgi:SAM-dependent methyltransferase
MNDYHKKIDKIIQGPFPKGSFALDLGCGKGRTSLYLAKKGLIVDSVDSNAVNINTLKDRVGDIKINTFCEDISRFHIENDKYSVVTAINVFPFIVDKKIVEKIIVSVANGLVSGGEFGFTLFGPKDAWSSRTDMSFFKYKEIIPTLERAGLKISESFEDEGDGPTMSGNIKYWHIHTYLCKK